MALLLYGVVGYEFNARTVADYLKENKKGPVHVRVDSPGGDAFAGMAIYNLLRTSGRHVTIEVDGLAASAASVIAMAGDDIAIAEGGFIMIHRASTLAFGNANDIKDEVAVLEKIDEAMAGIYSRRTTQSPATIAAMMDATTWMNAGEAIGKGFATRKSAAPARAARFDSTLAYANAPAAVAARLQVQSTSATVVAQEPSKTDMSLEELKATLESALAPVVARLAALEAPQASVAPAVVTPEPEPEPEPVVEIEPAVEDAAAADVRAMYLAAVESAFDRYCAQGKLAPSAKEHFVTASQAPAGFKALCAMYESAPSIVSGEPLKAAPVASAPARVYSPDTIAWAKKAQIDLTALDAKEAK